MIVQLTMQEARVLGVLIEKHLSTPDHYPLTINAATNACNQKSNRNPVVNFSESDVHDAVESLHRKQLAGRSISSGSRTTKYRHALSESWRLQRPELAVLSSLLLRGPQTLGELRTHCTRMHEFASLDDVAHTVDVLAERDDQVVKYLERRPGQKEARCAHLLSGEPQDDDLEEPSSSSSGSRGQSKGTSEIDELRVRIEALESAFEEFRKQFE